MGGGAVGWDFTRAKARRELLEMLGHCLRRHAVIRTSVIKRIGKDVMKLARVAVEIKSEIGLIGFLTTLCACDNHNVERGKCELFAVKEPKGPRVHLRILVRRLVLAPK